MHTFDSITKKLTIPVIVLFEIGWIVSTGGLSSFWNQLVCQSLSDYENSANTDEALMDPENFPHYFMLIGGQLSLCFCLPRHTTIEHS